MNIFENNLGKKMWWIIILIVLVLIILFVKKDELTGRWNIIPQDDWSEKDRLRKRRYSYYHPYYFVPPERPDNLINKGFRCRSILKDNEKMFVASREKGPIVEFVPDTMSKFPSVCNQAIRIDDDEYEVKKCDKRVKKYDPECQPFFKPVWY